MSPSCGIGRAAALQIWYKALTTYMTSSTNYAAARTAALNAATALYGASSAQYAGVQNAFAGIGVGSHAPVSGVTVTNPGNQASGVGTAVSLQISASSTNSGALGYAASGLPTGLSINASTGLISGTPTTAGTYNTTVTVTDSAAKTGTASFTWTVSTGGGTCTSAQLLGNAGFESGSASWTASSGVITNDSGQAAHGGSYKGWLNGYGSTHTDTLSQSVTIPAYCKATFTFWLHIDSAETTTSTQYDKLTVTAGSTTLATYSNLNKATGYTQKSFSLNGFAYPPSA